MTWPAHDAHFDVLVVGAGPAGALAARGLAANGAQVLLVDKATFPRWKVCGCCLNGAALRTLKLAGLGMLPEQLGANPLRFVRIATRGHTVNLSLPSGVALSRERFDNALVHAAIAAGAHFRANTAAEWVRESSDGIEVKTWCGNRPDTVRARIVIAADGLTAGFSRRIPGVHSFTSERSRIGAGATLIHPPKFYMKQSILLLVGSGGYVGMVQAEERLHVAAAFDVKFVHTSGGLATSASRILRQCGLPEIDALKTTRWSGTPPLTRSMSPPTSERVFVVGDAAEYVEPFTGEGMAWALAGGVAVVRHALAALDAKSIHARDHWLLHCRSLFDARRRRCRWVAAVLRYPQLTGLCIRLLNWQPSLAHRYLDVLNTPNRDPIVIGRT